MIEAMADAAVAMGLSRKRRIKLFLKRFWGLQKWKWKRGNIRRTERYLFVHPQEPRLCDRILEESGFRYSIIKALKVGEEKCSRISK
jgi:hypothetical protein